MTTENFVFEQILSFLKEIEIPVEYSSLEENTFLPGLKIDKGLLRIDLTQLKYEGDILHEAGHIALMKPEERSVISGNLEGIEFPEASEMMVIAWTYAACLEIGINPEVVFHSEGYKGYSSGILENFKEGRYFGVPMLQWLGLTNEKADLTQNPPITAYPIMKAWKRV